MIPCFEIQIEYFDGNKLHIIIQGSINYDYESS